MALKGGDVGHIKDLAERVRVLPIAHKLRLAADLVDRGRADMAEIVADLALIDLQAARLFGKTKRLTGQDSTS